MKQPNGVAYLAAPLFTNEERALNLELASILSHHFKVYLPQRDGLLLADEIARGMPVDVVKRRIFSLDLQAIKDSDIVFAVLNGRTIDEGVAFELGYAYAMGKPCLAYKEDWRVLLKHGDNPMIEGGITHLFSSLKEVVGYVGNLRL